MDQSSSHLSPVARLDCAHKHELELEDRVPLLALMTEYLAITYNHCEPQQCEREHQTAPPTANCEYAVQSGAVSASSRRVLTKKVEPAGNDGFDNEDRNLIVRVRDILGGDDGSATAANSDKREAAPTAAGTATGSSSLPNDASARYIVLDLLGQGTFGQVFRCQHMSTKQIVAVKVIRNHPSYYKQAIVEVQLTRMLNRTYSPECAQHIVRLLNNFEFRGHLCLVFELLSMNVYELITENNFTGFPMEVTRGFLEQLLHALVQLADAGVIHCDLKPENILLAGLDRLYEDPMQSSERGSYMQSCSSAPAIPLLKVVDFGSACHENETVYSYIQSRFYRSPEVLLGIPYNGAIDMWSLGCIAFEMLLGLPLFPGVSEHDQLRLIEETLGQLPQHLLRKGRNVLKFYDVRSRQSCAARGGFTGEFVLKSPEQFAKETSSEVRSAKKYFKYSKLDDLVYAYPFRENATSGERIYEMERRQAFLDFLGGLLVADPAARWTAREALQHPFMTGERFLRDAAPLYELPGKLHDSMQLQLQRHTDTALYYQQQQQQQQQQQSYGLERAGYPHMATLLHPEQMVPLPPPVYPRVCPIDPMYVDASGLYYSGQLASSYAYDQPWTPNYVPAMYSMGPGRASGGGDYVYETSHPTLYEPSSHEQPQMCWTETSYESFVPPLPVQRTKQKVAPAPPTRPAVMPVHSPHYNSLQRFEHPYGQQFAYTHDPSFILPLNHQHPMSVAPVSQQFQTPPKAHHYRRHQQQHHRSSSSSSDSQVGVGLADSSHKTAAGRGTRRRRPTQPRVLNAGLSLPNLGPAASSSGGVGNARQLTPTALASARTQQHKSKRRSEHESDVSDVSERRSWKSPRGSNATVESRHIRASPHDSEARDDANDTGDQCAQGDAGLRSSADHATRSDELYFAEPQYLFASPAPPLPT